MSVLAVLKNPGETDEESIRRHGHYLNEENMVFFVKEEGLRVRVLGPDIKPKPGFPIIMGDGICNDAKAYYDARDVLEGHGNVVLGAQISYELNREIPPGSIIYNLEHLVPDKNQIGAFARDINFLDILKTGKFTVWDYQRRNVEYLRTLGIEARHVPFGYHPCLERVTPVEQDIDILFYGSFTTRRQVVLRELMNAGMKAGIKCEFVFHNLYGEELDKMIARAKIVLNIHRLSGHPLEVVRINYLLANKCFVISERGNDDIETAIYDDALVFSDYADIVRTCLEYLDKDREAIATRGREIIRSMPMKP